MSRTIRNDENAKFYRKECKIARRSHNRSIRGKAAQMTRAIVKDPELAYEATLPRFRGTEGWLTH